MKKILSKKSVATVYADRACSRIRCGEIPALIAQLKILVKAAKPQRDLVICSPEC